MFVSQDNKLLNDAKYVLIWWFGEEIYIFKVKAFGWSACWSKCSYLFIYSAKTEKRKSMKFW